MFEAFAGYGSQALAMEMARIPYKPIGISEIKPEALTAYRALHGYVRNYGDISKVNWDKVPYFDLFTYSFPCTDISRIGDKAGLAEGTGTSSSLLWECEKAILAKRPKWLLMENVSDLLSAKFRPDFEQWIARLEAMGYNNYYKVINAKDYIPQNRERIFMVSVLKEYDRGFEFNANPQRTRYKQLSDILLPLGPLLHISKEKLTVSLCVLRDWMIYPPVAAKCFFLVIVGMQKDTLLIFTNWIVRIVAQQAQLGVVTLECTFITQSTNRYANLQLLSKCA